jgi:NAD+ synthase (glutamine-hydrolysing)
MKIALAQITVITGDLEGNTNRVLQAIEIAKSEAADVVLLPETAITGYCCGALFEEEMFIRRNVEILNQKIVPATVYNNLVVIIGFVGFNGVNKDGSLELANSVATIQHGKIVNVYDKILLANAYHQEDRKYFTKGENVSVAGVQIQGKSVKLGTPVCEDSWNNIHERDIVQEMVELGAEVVLIPNYSYFHYGKKSIRHEIVRNHALEKKVPVIYLNVCGIGDIVKNIMIFDGGSFAYNADGNLIADCKTFAEDFFVVETDTENALQVNYPDKYAEIFDALVFEQKEMFRLSGLSKAQVHLSGGIDSAVIACVAEKAMGAENCVFVTNPTKDNSETTQNIAAYIADKLNVKLHWYPTQSIYEVMTKDFTRIFGQPNNMSLTTMQAVGRTVQGLALCHHFKTGIVATGNHTEMVLGWATFHDIGSVGVHSPIADLTKLEIFALAKYINQYYADEIIPASLYDGSVKPAAELVDAKDDPFDYRIISGICASLIRERKNPTQIMADFDEKCLNPDFFPEVDGEIIYDFCSRKVFQENVDLAFRLSKRSVYKQAQAAPIVCISPRTRGFSSRETLINFYSGV